MKVYISSTYQDLREYREAVVRVLRRLNHEVIGMEDYIAADERPLERALADVAECDVYIGIFAHRYGYVPEGPANPEGLSITELEYRRARDLGKRYLVFMLSEGTPWPPRFVDFGSNRKKLEALRTALLQSGSVATFERADELAALVAAAVANIMEKSVVDTQRPEYDVFISYNTQDREAAGELAGRLQRDGIRLWWWAKLGPGDEWAKETQSAMARSAVNLVLIGPKGISNLQEQEVSIARAEARDFHSRLIPVLLPGARPEQVPQELASYLWVDFSASLDNPVAYNSLRNAILGIAGSAPPPPTPVLSPKDLQMLPELLFRLVARLRERPEMLQNMEVTAFWDAVRKIPSEASSIVELHALNAQLSTEPAPSALWAAWIRNTKANELAALLKHPPTPATRHAE